jgi:type VI secretion system protein ImpL
MVDSKRTSIARRASPGATTTISFIVSLAVSNVGYACQFLDKKGLEDGESSLTIAYLSLAERFNSGLQGRFPFADELEGYEASVDGIREVRKALDQLQISNDIQELPVRVQDFLRALDRSLAFLKPMVGYATGDSVLPLRYSITVERNKSVHVEQILDWSIAVGQFREHLDSKPHLGAWHVAEPVSIQFIWADDSPWQPTSFPGGRQPITSGSRVDFEYTGYWSILRMLRIHALPQQYEDRKGVTLRFQVPVGAEESTHMGDRLAEVFIQMTLVGDDGKEISPPVFPVQAPCF